MAGSWGVLGRGNPAVVCASTEEPLDCSWGLLNFPP